MADGSDFYGLCFSGNFAFVEVYDILPNGCLTENYQIPALDSRTLMEQQPDEPCYLRMRRCSGPGPRIAISGMTPPFVVLVLDVQEKRIAVECFGHLGGICGLATIPPSLCSNERIVSGDRRSKILLFDVLTGMQLMDFADAPRFCSEILHVPEWNENEFLVAAKGRFSKFSLVTGRESQLVADLSGNLFGFEAVRREGILVTAANQELRLFSERDFACVHKATLSAWASCCFYAEEQRLLMVALKNGEIETWDLRQTRRKVLSFAPSCGAVWGMATPRLRDSVVLAGTLGAEVFNLDGLKRSELRSMSTFAVCAFDGAGLVRVSAKSLHERCLFLLEKCSFHCQVTYSNGAILSCFASVLC